METAEQIITFAREHKFWIAALVPFAIAVVVLKILG
jgi:hypothetical protein